MYFKLYRVAHLEASHEGLGVGQQQHNRLHHVQMEQFTINIVSDLGKGNDNVDG